MDEVRPHPQHADLVAADIETARHWFRGLSADQQAEVRKTVGAAPQWMVASLRAVGLQPIPIHADYRRGPSYLLPMALLMLLSTEEGSSDYG